MEKTSKWAILGQMLAVSMVMIAGLMVISTVKDPAWEVQNQAAAAIEIAVGLESKWEDSHVNRLSASDVEGWGLAPSGWRRSGNGWRVGPDEERFEVGTWQEDSGKSGFALIFFNIDQARCREMGRLLGNAFDQYAVNDKGHDCRANGNKLVFYRSPTA